LIIGIFMGKKGKFHTLIVTICMGYLLDLGTNLFSEGGGRGVVLRPGNLTHD
jgi:hypothetical protein